MSIDRSSFRPGVAFAQPKDPDSVKGVSSFVGAVPSGALSVGRDDGVGQGLLQGRCSIASGGSPNSLRIGRALFGGLGQLAEDRGPVALGSERSLMEAPQTSPSPLLGSPVRGSRLVAAGPPGVSRMKAVPEYCLAVKQAFLLLGRGFFSVVCADGEDHSIRFIEQGRGQFNAYCSIHGGQSQILRDVLNESLGLKIFHREMRHFDSGMQARMISLHRALCSVGIPCAEVYNREEFIRGCGYLLVEHVPLPSGLISPEELLPLVEKAYEARLFIDLKLDNLRRTLAGDLKVVDWGGELKEDESDLDAHFRRILSVCGLKELAKTSSILSSLTSS